MDDISFMEVMQTRSNIMELSGEPIHYKLHND